MVFRLRLTVDGSLEQQNNLLHDKNNYVVILGFSFRIFGINFLQKFIVVVVVVVFVKVVVVVVVNDDVVVVAVEYPKLELLKRNS